MRLTEVTEQPILEGPHDPHIFKAVFMAGAPGSGKSTVARKIFGGTGLKFLNVDRFWQLYSTLGREGDYETYWDKYQTQDRLYREGRLGLLIDGTARNPTKMSEVKSTLEGLGYEAAMVFVNTNLETAITRARKRAQQPGPDQGREIDPEFIRRAWEHTQQAIGTYQSVFGSRFLIVDNSDHARPSSLAYVERQMRNWLNQPPTNHIARKWLEQQQGGRSAQHPGMD